MLSREYIDNAMCWMRNADKLHHLSPMAQTAKQGIRLAIWGRLRGGRRGGSDPRPRRAVQAVDAHHITVPRRPKRCTL